MRQWWPHRARNGSACRNRAILYQRAFKWPGAHSCLCRNLSSASLQLLGFCPGSHPSMEADELASMMVKSHFQDLLDSVRLETGEPLTAVTENNPHVSMFCLLRVLPCQDLSGPYSPAVGLKGSRSAFVHDAWQVLQDRAAGFPRL